MSLTLPQFLVGLVPGWVRNFLWTKAQAVPSLDLRFADNKSLADATTGANLVTFTRASSGTYVGSDGVLRAATTNLLLRSEEFDNASWTKAGLLAFGSGSTANAITAPNGSTAADLLTEDTSTGQHRAYQTVSGTVNANAYTLSVYVKAKERTRFYVGIVDSPGFSRQGNAIFNLSNGTVVSASAGLNGATGGVASIQDVGNGWYRCSYALVLGGTNTAIFCDLNIVSAGSTISYTGDGTSGIYLWGAQLEQSSTVGEYIPTTSTINSAPRFDHAITSSVTNLLLRSEEFDNASWIKFRGSVVANSLTAPNGSATAEKLVEDTTATATHGLYQSATVLNGSQYVFSVYLKAGERTAAALRASLGGGEVNAAFFNLSNGTILSTASGYTSSIVSVGDGWYRCSVAATSSVTSSVFVVTTSIGMTNGYTGDGTSGIYLWGAQLEQSANVGTYVPTTTAAATSNTTESLGLLVEEQRTNSIRNNTMVGAVAGTPGTNPTNWFVYVGSGTGVATSIVGTGVESGITYVDIRFNGTPSASSTWSVINEPGNAIAAATGQSWTYSAWARISAGSSVNVTSPAIFFDENQGSTYVTGGFTAVSYLTSAWQRYSATRTLSGGATVDRVNGGLRFGVTAGQAIDITLRIGLPQLEQGAFATSVIPTTTATATRNADVASITGSNFSSWYRQDEGTVFTDASVSYVVPATSFPLMASLNDGTQNNRIENGYLTAGLGGYEVVAGGVAQVGVYPGANTQARRLATAYRVNDFAACLNNGTLNTDLSGTVPAVDRLRLGNRLGGSSNDLFGTIRRLTYWPARLPNSTLQTLTQ